MTSKNHLDSSPSVSIIIPAYNCERFIEATLQSVFSQTYSDFEVIVIDDASTDTTFQKINSVAVKDPRVKVLKSEKNLGQAGCRNRASREALGSYIAFIDSDDIWLEDKLERQLAFVRERNLSFCYCGHGTIDAEGEVLIPDLKIPAHTNFRSLLKSNPICTSSVIYDREKLGDIVMPERPWRREDWISWLTVSKELVGDIHGIPDPLCMIRRVAGSSSSNKIKLLPGHWAVYRTVAGLGIFSSTYYLVNFMFSSLAKRISASSLLKRNEQ